MTNTITCRNGTKIINVPVKKSQELVGFNYDLLEV